MKGAATVKSLRVTALYILDKVRTLLTTEPARLIGYGAAVVVTLVAQFLSNRGYVRFDGVGFEDSLVLVLAAITFTVTVVEAIRRFVFSPQTYIEQVSDAVGQGHYEAHAEEEAQRFIDSLLRDAELEDPEPEPVVRRGVVPVGTTTDRVN